jgi:hypothetical protein
MSVNKNTLTGTGYQNLLTLSGLNGKTVSNVEIYKGGVTYVVAITPSSGNPCYILVRDSQVQINSSGVGNDEWTSSGGVLVTPQAV